MDGFWPHGETILEYSVYDALRAWFGKVVFVIREDFAPAFKEQIGSKFENALEVEYVYQKMDSYVPEDFSTHHREKPWGTAHAVLVAKEKINEPFVVINADDYYGVDAYKKMYDYLQNNVSEKQCSMVWYILKNTLSPYGSVNRGVCNVKQDNTLISVSERLSLQRGDNGIVRDMHGREADENAIVSMNFWWFDASNFDYIERLFHLFLEKQGIDPTYEFFIPSVVNNFIHEWAQCKVMISEDNRCGVTNRDDKQYVQETLSHLIENNVYPSVLFEETNPS